MDYLKFALAIDTSRISLTSDETNIKTLQVLALQDL